MKILAMFPGQGSQHVGMGRRLFEEFPQIRYVFQEAEDTIRLPIRRICFDGPVEELTLTAVQQPCLVTISVAMWDVLRGETAISPSWCAGHSLGEYSALVASGRLSFAKAISLVRERGLAMQRAVPSGDGAMYAVVGFDSKSLESLCRSQRAEGNESCNSLVEIANYNSPQQQIISGTKSAVELLASKLTELGVKTVPLPVSAPFHSSLMAPARREMEPFLEKLTFDATSDVPLMIPNLTGAIESQYTFDLLLNQIDRPVLWSQSLDSAARAGTQLAIEVGPGRVLTNLAKRSHGKQWKVLNCADSIIETIKTLNSFNERLH